MTDQRNGQSTDDDDRVSNEWVMPEPVFRSTEGFTPKGRASGDAGEPTEEPVTASPSVGDVLGTETPTAERIRVIPVQPKASKGGCAMSAMVIVGLIGFAIVGVALALVYYYNNVVSAGTFD